MATIQELMSLVPERANDLYNDFLANPTSTAIGGAIAGGTVVGATLAIAGAATKKRRKTSKKKSSSSKRSKSRSGSYARTAGKRKDTSRKRIRMTKNGQPYVIMASGKARFISKRSARLSRKRKGGRY